jgi:hypothetical protein
MRAQVAGACGDESGILDRRLDLDLRAVLDCQLHEDPSMEHISPVHNRLELAMNQHRSHCSPTVKQECDLQRAGFFLVFSQPLNYLLFCLP